MFDIKKYKYDEKHNYLEIGGEAMVFHCHHYIINLHKTILDAKNIKSTPFLIGSAADAIYNQLTNLCKDLNIEESKKMAEEIYKCFGYGLIKLKELNENGIKVQTTKSFFSKTWEMKFGKSTFPVDFYTLGFLAAVYAVVFNKKLKDINVSQDKCMACGDEFNEFTIKEGKCNFSIYPKKSPTKFKEVKKETLNWEHEKTITDTFINAHQTMVGNEIGLIPAFGVYIVRNQSDYVNRLQIEFANKMAEEIGSYGVTLAGELLMESGHACGFFTYGGILTSKEWEMHVKPLVSTKEDWIKGLISLINTMGWGYHTATMISKEKSVFRNYNDFEDLSFLRMYGKNNYPIHWANSGGFTGLMHLIYGTSLFETGVIETEEGFLKMRQAKVGYKTKMKKGISCGDDYLEVEVYL